MDNWIFWLLVFPVLLVAILYVLGFITVGSSVVAKGVESKNPSHKIILILIGLAIITAPFTSLKIKRVIVGKKADIVYEQLAALERIDLKGRLPKKFVTVGNFLPRDIEFIKSRYRMSLFPEPENERLKAAYRSYRKTAYCHKYHYKERIASNLNLSNCRELPASIQSALNIKEPVLFIAEGSNTSLRRSNIFTGEKYEIRLVTLSEDLLVEYFEEREVDNPKGLLNPYSSWRKRDSKEKPQTMREFIESALQSASR